MVLPLSDWEGLGDGAPQTTLPRTHAVFFPPPTVYKTRLLRKELSDDFDDYIMVIEQIIKSG